MLHRTLRRDRESVPLFIRREAFSVDVSTAVGRDSVPVEVSEEDSDLDSGDGGDPW